MRRIYLPGSSGTVFRALSFIRTIRVFFADEERMMPIYDTAKQLGLIVLLHSGVDIGLEGAVHCTPLMIKRVLENIPGIKLVAAHMGSHALWRDVEETLIGRDVYLDTSYSSYELKQEGMLRMIKKPRYGQGTIRHRLAVDGRSS